MIRVVKHFTEYSETFRVYWQAGNTGEITVSRHMGVMGEAWQAGYVNWPGCGDKTAVEAMTFVLAMQVAVYLCDCLNGNSILAITELNRICQCEMVDTTGKPVEK